MNELIQYYAFFMNELINELWKKKNFIMKK